MNDQPLPLSANATDAEKASAESAQPNSNENIPENEFHLAITMAGAASAGCYTGGVMDYLFEMLDLWEKARDPNSDVLAGSKHLVPPHKVIIDAFGGTSAGGMTSTMSVVYALNGKINPVSKPGQVKERKDNLFYDSWVLMDDMDPDDDRETFEKVWDRDDLQQGRVHSMLNSSFIDRIAEKLFSFKEKLGERVKYRPAYISPNLQLLLSHCFLRGMPLDVNFETPISKKGRKSVLPNHTTFEHYLVSQFHLNGGNAAPDPDKYLWLNPYDATYSDTLKLATKATGAFPVGLLYREFTIENFNYKYLKTVLKRIALGELGNPDPDPEERIKLNYLAKDFNTLAVDGGAINNEPYREVISLLKDKYGPTPADGFPRYGVVMIDPFPDRAQTAKEYEKPEDLLDVIPGIIGALTDQSRVKRRELLENDQTENFRGIIFPRKWKKLDAVDNDSPGASNADAVTPAAQKERVRPVNHPLCSSAALAFGGLLDIKFRQHDYFLGRDNARNFFRFFFSLPYDKEAGIVHPIHRQWSDEMKELFLIEKGGKYFLPIVPDLNLIKEGLTARTYSRYSYTVDKVPTYDPERLFRLRGAMKKRFKEILTLILNRPSKKQTSKTPNADQWISALFRKSLPQKIGGFFSRQLMRVILFFGKGVVAGEMADAAIKTIIKDLDRNEGLDKPVNE
ncbi:MAG: hypothetical protein ACTHMM_13945 [Agriterribacter sp.]